MEINTNLSNTVAASISKLNLNNSSRSFENRKPKEEQEITPVTEEKQEIIEEPVNKKMQINVEDIQKYAKYMGENLSIDDINYALRYGRSVIADYSV